jgi:protein-S-isoprenylcysteine O-methyltransferase Ste14
MTKVLNSVRDLWVWGQFTLIALVLFGVPWLATNAAHSGALSWLTTRDPTWRFAGVAPLLLGGLVMLLSALNLGRNLTPATTPISDGEMVERGLYAHVRHPMYAGLILLLWGLAWIGSNWRMGLLVAVISLGYFDRKAATEEGKLVLRYPGYPAYMRRVPKLIPRLGGGS